ncbi:MAG: hypothetical protein LBE27_08685 [Deltaproteobacteria bacterium]|jgi:hypothetical protein|nr:hypothetical protein [Deltaproteobacteria bacterium]
MKKKLIFIIIAIFLTSFTLSCYKPYPADLDTLSLNLIIGQSTPADIISVLGEPSSRDRSSGYDTYIFTFSRVVLRVFVDMPGSDDDKILMIDGAEDPLHATFSNGVLTSAY